MSASIAALALTVLGSGCTSNLSRFDVLNLGGTKDVRQITRAETSDQGSGTVSSVYGPGGHTMSRVTVGGYYLRRAGAAAPGTPGTVLNAGLYGNPAATK